VTRIGLKFHSRFLYLAAPVGTTVPDFSGNAHHNENPRHQKAKITEYFLHKKRNEKQPSDGMLLGWHASFEPASHF
jgi:hypothetical protein